MEEVVVPRQDEVAGSRLDAGPIHRAENNHGWVSTSAEVSAFVGFQNSLPGGFGSDR